MGWNGKVIGGVLGFAALGGPLGALLGAVVGHQYDNYADAKAGIHSAVRVQALFFSSMFRVMGHVAKADGRVSEQEIAAARMLMQALRLGPDQVQQAIDHYTVGKQPQFSLEATLRELRGALGPYPQMRQFFIELQLQTALAGNGLAPASRERLRKAANLLGFADASFARLETMMRWRAGGAPSASSPAADAERLAQAYALLDVAGDASDEQVTRAYRRQMSRHHPDKLQANGLPESMLERAKERTQQIQAAYELLRAARGMR